MKYIDADKLRKAIEDKGLDCSFALKMERLDTLALIDELQQEQPEISLPSNLDEAAVLSANGAVISRQSSIDGRVVYNLNEKCFNHEDLVRQFKAGVKWQREQIMKGAVEGIAEELYNDGEPQCTIGVGTYFRPGQEVYVIEKEGEK